MKKILAAVIAFAIVGFNGFILLEGAVSNAATVTGTPSTTLGWDVYLDVSSEISLTCDTAAINLGTINGMTGGTLTSLQRVCNVETNNAAGWKLEAKATSSPAMQRADLAQNFENWATNGSDITCATAEDWFGYSVSTTYPGGATFGSATGYNGLLTTDAVVASSTAPTNSNGIDNGFYFKACSGATNNQPTGVYTAHVVVTATNN